MKNKLKFSVIGLLVLGALVLGVVGCATGRSSSQPPPDTRMALLQNPDGWATHLNELPDSLHAFLVNTYCNLGQKNEFREKAKASLIKQNVTDVAFLKPYTEADVITDNPNKFQAGCERSEGEADMLFLRAKKIGDCWVLHYEHGGLGHSSVLVILRYSGGTYAVVDQIPIDPTERRSWERFASLISPFRNRILQKISSP